MLSLAAGLQKRVEPKLLLTLLLSLITNYFLFHHSPSSALLTAGLPISSWECFVFGLVHAGLVYMQIDLAHCVITIATMSDYSLQSDVAQDCCAGITAVCFYTTTLEDQSACFFHCWCHCFS